MNPSKLIQYVGKKLRKRDTVAGTGTIWSGNGDVQRVEHGAAVKLLEHPDVWQEMVVEQSGDTLQAVSPVAPVTLVTPAVPAASEANDEEEIDALTEAVKVAVLALDRDNAEHFTEKGRPRLEAVRETVPEASIQVLNTVWKEIEG